MQAGRLLGRRQFQSGFVCLSLHHCRSVGGNKRPVELNPAALQQRYTARFTAFVEGRLSLHATASCRQVGTQSVIVSLSPLVRAVAAAAERCCMLALLS